MVAADDVVDVVQDREERHAGRRNQQPGSQLCAYRLHSCPGVHGSAPLPVKPRFRLGALGCCSCSMSSPLTCCRPTSSSSMLSGSILTLFTVKTRIPKVPIGKAPITEAPTAIASRPVAPNAARLDATCASEEVRSTRAALRSFVALSSGPALR